MGYRRAEGANWPDEPGATERLPGFVRARIFAVRAFFAARFRGGRPADEVAGSVSRQTVPVAPLRYLAAAPPAPTASAPLFDTGLATELRGLLGTLGSSCGSVATALEAAGVRATPGDPHRSPVGLFLSAVVGADPTVKAVRVRGDAVVVDLRAWWRPTVTVPLPPVVVEFRAAFDAGCYPALLRDALGPHGVPERARGTGHVRPLGQTPAGGPQTSGQG